uniref:Uncharacterized protein n=1 Tax=Xiphophorus couchianus TaxID=32473 RepID=A0A3B5MF17_9TELE
PFCPFSILHKQDPKKFKLLHSHPCLEMTLYPFQDDGGVTLRRQVRDATVEVLDGVLQLLEVIISSPLQSLTQEQITSTGGVWSACDRFAQLPKDNKEALLVVVSSQSGVVKDAVEEMEQVLSETQDPFSDFLIDDPDDDNPRGNQDVYLSEKDRQVISACQGLMKAAAACLRKLRSAVKANGDAADPQKVAQLDDLADISREISPSVDDLALCLYPPVNYSGVENHVRQPCILSDWKNRINLFFILPQNNKEAELTWVQFFETAVDHNVQKAKESIELDG